MGVKKAAGDCSPTAFMFLKTAEFYFIAFNQS